MIRAFFVEFVFPLLLFLFLRSLVRNFLQGARTKSQSQPRGAAPQSTPVSAGGELKKDPVCGTYVSTSLGITRSAGGEVMYFCSKECRDKWIGASSRSAV